MRISWTPYRSPAPGEELGFPAALDATRELVALNPEVNTRYRKPNVDRRIVIACSLTNNHFYLPET
jgi:hypothetical protein